MRRRDFIWILGGGIAATIPLRAHAQQPIPTVGVLVAGTRETSTFPELFLRYMKELGWDDGRNYRVLFLGTGGHNELYPTLVSDLVAKRVNVIIVFGNPGIEAARRATTTIPIVGVADDLVASGFAASMTSARRQHYGHQHPGKRAQRKAVRAAA
jgi:putative tryptophan/tyrosine transport system substrate-binding protein